MARLPDPVVVGPFAELLDRIRGELSLTAFAEKVGVGQSDISKYRQGGLPDPENFAAMKRRPILLPFTRELESAYQERAKQRAAEANRAAERTPSNGEAKTPVAELADSIMATLPPQSQKHFVNALDALNEMMALGSRAELSVFRYLADLSNSAWKRSADRPDYNATGRSTPPDEAVG